MSIATIYCSYEVRVLYNVDGSGSHLVGVLRAPELCRTELTRCLPLLLLPLVPLVSLPFGRLLVDRLSTPSVLLVASRRETPHALSLARARSSITATLSSLGPFSVITTDGASLLRRSSLVVVND